MCSESLILRFIKIISSQLKCTVFQRGDMLNPCQYPYICLPSPTQGQFKYVLMRFPHDTLQPYCDPSAQRCCVTYPLAICFASLTAPASPKRIPPPCGRQLIPVPPQATEAQDFITHTGQGRYLCFPLSLGGLTLYWLGLSIEPWRGAMEPPMFKFSHPFYLVFLISSTGN